jgi:inner membrane protein
MDSLTQMALGGVIAEAGFREKLGGRAVLLGCLGGMLPDADIVTGMIVADPWVNLTVHRGITHSLFCAPLLSVVVAWIFWRWSKRTPSFWWWYLLAFLVLFTHPLLDCCTSYGTQIFAPFSPVRVAWNCVSIVDIFYSFPLFFTLITCAVLKKWWPQKHTTWLGIAALLLTTTYLIYGGWNHAEALERTRTDAQNKKLTILRAEVYPQLTTVWVWRTVVKTPQGYLVGRTNTLLGKTVTATFVSHNTDPWIDRAQRLKKIKLYRWFADDLLRGTVTRYPQGGGTVSFFDMRYGNPMGTDHYLWGARAYVNQDGDFGNVERFYNRSFSPGELVRRIITDITTP